MLASDSEIQRILRCRPHDHAFILGVADKLELTPVSLRKQYLKLAVQVHPDKHGPILKGQAHQAFVLLSQAYEAKLSSLNSGVRATEFASQQNTAQVQACVSCTHAHTHAQGYPSWADNISQPPPTHIHAHRRIPIHTHTHKHTLQDVKKGQKEKTAGKESANQGIPGFEYVSKWWEKPWR